MVRLKRKKRRQTVIKLADATAISQLGRSGIHVDGSLPMPYVVTFWWLAGGINAYVNALINICELNTECSMRMRYQDQITLLYKYSSWFGPFTTEGPGSVTKICLVSTMVEGREYSRELRLNPTDTDNWVTTGWFQWGDNFVQPAKGAPLEEEYVPGV